MCPRSCSACRSTALFLRFDLIGSVVGLASAHAIGGMPLVVMIVSAALQGRRQAARAGCVSAWGIAADCLHHGDASRYRAGLAAATFFAFLHSFDELVLSLFLSSAELKTLPLMLWGDINYRLNPVLAVVSTLEVLLVVGGSFLARPVLATSQKAT